MAWQDDPVVNATAPRSSNPSDFYNRAYNAVLQAATNQGLENPEVIARLGAAQSSLETGYGKSAPGNNFFGVKGPGQTQRTQEVIDGQRVTINDSFRAYNSLEDSANDYVKFLRENPRYARVLASKSPDEAIAFQGRSGYATDPNYGPSLASIHSKYSNRPAAMVQQALNAVIPPAQAAAPAKGGWMDDPVVEAPAPAAKSGGWMNDPVVGETKKATLPDIVVPKAAEKQPDQPKSTLRRVDDFVRGLADTATFGYADEIAARLDRLFGINTGKQGGPAPRNFDEALAAQRALDKEGGGERLAGQIGGAFVPGAGLIGAIRAPATASRLARIGAGAGTGAVQGALYGSGSAEGDMQDRISGAIKGGTIGAVTGGVLGGVLPSSVRQEGGSIIKRAGSDRAAAMDAEIIRDINQVAGNATQRSAPVGATQLNALENRYIGDVNTALKQVGKKTLEASGLKADDISSAIRDRRILTETELNALRNTKAGTALADAIEKAQRARSLTAPVPAATNPLARIGRATLDLAPLPQPIRQAGQRMLGSRQTREDVAQRLVSDKQAAAAEDVLSRLGPSAATQSLGDLQSMASQSLAQQAAQAQARVAARATARAPKVENPNALISDVQSRDPSYILGLSNQLGAPRNATQMDEFSKLIRQQMEARAAKEAMAREAAQAARGGSGTDVRNAVLAETRRPLGGGFQELLQGGRAGTNLQSAQAIDALRLLKRRGGTVGEAADQILKSRPVTNEDAFYGLQNAVRGLQERGVISTPPGALSAASSGVRNPISYAEAVRTAGEAANLARASAPSKELAQFATKVAGTKTPADKAKLLQDRLAKTSDPAEVSYLTNFIEPLTRFGAK